MAKDTSDIDNSNTPEDAETFTDEGDNLSQQSSEKNSATARRRFDDILEERKLSRQLKDDLYDW